MEILFLSAWFPSPPDNGSKIRVYHLLRTLGQSHTVTLIAFAFGTACPDAAYDLSDFCYRVHSVPVSPYQRPLILHRLRFLSPVPIVNLPRREMTAAIRHVTDRFTFDVIVTSTEVMAAYALQVDRSVLVLEEHNSMTRWMWERYQCATSSLRRLFYWASWQKMRYYEARLLNQFDLCTMVSDQDRDVTRSSLPGYKGRVEVVPNGVDCQYNHPDLDVPQANSLVFNGSLTYDANYDAMRYFLREVYPLVQSQCPELALTITGSTTGVDVDALTLHPGVHFSGYVNDVRPLVARAWAVVAPIRQGGGTRLKILEAMALGTPVIATSKGAEGLKVIHEETILIADTPEAFAQQVLRLFRDVTLRERLRTHARRLVEREYDWVSVGARFVSLVETVVDMRRCPGGRR